MAKAAKKAVPAKGGKGGGGKSDHMMPGMPPKNMGKKMGKKM